MNIQVKSMSFRHSRAERYLSKPGPSPGMYQLGLSFIELMIASLLSVFLLAGILQVMTNTTTTKALDNGLTEVQESGRYALDAMADVIRYRGFQGCILPLAIDQTQVDNIDWDSVSQTRSVADDVPLPNFAASSLRGYEVSAGGVWTPDPAAQGYSEDIVALINDADVPAPINGSDVLSIQYASPQGINLSAAMASPTDDLTIDDNALGIEANSVLFVGDCLLGDVFRVSAEPGAEPPFSIQHENSSNSTASLRRNYGTDAQVRLFNIDTLYIGDTGRRDTTGNMIPALFRRDINGDVTELVEGIERLEIRYGEVLSTGNIRYLSADAMGASDWPRVVTIEIGLLARTTREILPQADDSLYRLPGTVVTPSSEAAYTPGRYLRKVFTTLVEVRNRA